jgi:hypothetical protein
MADVDDGEASRRWGSRFVGDADYGLGLGASVRTIRERPPRMTLLQSSAGEKGSAMF